MIAAQEVAVESYVQYDCLCHPPMRQVDCESVYSEVILHRHGSNKEVEKELHACNQGESSRIQG